VKYPDLINELAGAADRAGIACTRDGTARVAMIDPQYLRAAILELDNLHLRIRELEDSIAAFRDQRPYAAPE
jgi:hypothetical protein